MPVTRTKTVKKPAAKKVAAKKVATKTATPADPVAALADNIAKAIVGGELDQYLGVIDTAVITRLERHQSESATPAKSVVAEPKKVSAAPKRKSIVPKPKSDYLVGPGTKLSGAKVKFLNFKNGDETKGVVQMLTDKPGAPKGKKVLLPIAALENITAAAAKPAKRTPAKRVAK